MALKISASVPDDLWELSVRRSRLESPSAIVQDALRKAYAEPSGASLAMAASGVPSRDRLEAIRDRMRLEVQQLWQRGYDAALDLAEKLSWEALQGYGPYRTSDLTVWLQGAFPPADYEVIQEFLDEIGYLEAPMPASFHYGFDKALAEIWEAVSETEESPEDDDDVPF